MRLTHDQHLALVRAVHRHFGPHSRAWLFGSRTDDRARGGDFDVMVVSEEPDAAVLVDAKLALLADLHATAAFEDERIDVLLWSRRLDPEPSAIQRVALEQGLELTA